MKPKMLRIVDTVINARFIEMLKAGAFPSVCYKIDDKGYTSFALMEYVAWVRKFASLVHDQLVAAGYKDGIYSRSRSEAFRDATKSFARRIMPEDVLLVP
jgi:hypothetical protein